MEEKTALLIDPSHQLSVELSYILKPPEWTVHEAADNAAALSLVQAFKFDFILTSETTSGRDDVELLRKIRGLHSHTRMIILADETTPADVIDAMREGAFSYFLQPISFQALVEMVKNATEGPCWDDGIEVLSGTPAWLRLAARCDVKTAERLVQFIHVMIDLPDDEKDTVAAALRELLMNAIEYGGNFDPEQYVEMSYLRTKRAVACRLKDPGEGFSLNEIFHSAVMNPPEDPLRHVHYREAESLRPGGFGVLLARNSVDELIYNEQGNSVLLIKYV
ncbi:MAG: ATP-binding protein [Acidobacteriaceae bacterium]|nr:ATP-binding protein [Acidobacteriaceae bacterium]